MASLLCFGTSRKGQAVYQGWLLPFQVWGQVNKRSEAPQDQPPPANCLLGSVAVGASGGDWVEWNRFSVSHQGGEWCSPCWFKLKLGSNAVWGYSIKVSEYNKANWHPPEILRPLLLGLDKATRVHQAKIHQDWQCGENTSHRMMVPGSRQGEK